MVREPIKQVLLAALAATALTAGPPPQTEWFGQVVAQSSLAAITTASIAVEPAAQGLITDGAGRFWVQAPADAQLRISAPGFLDGFVQLRAGRDPDLGRLVLRAELSLDGRLMLAGEPAAGVVVPAPRELATGPPLAATHETRTDERGTFHLDGLRPEHFQELVFIRSGVAEALDLGSPLWPFDARGYDLGTIELAPLRPVDGRIVGPDGQPAPDAVVRVRSSSTLRLRNPRPDTAAETRIPQPRAHADGEGRFHLALPRGEPTLSAWSPTAGAASTVVRLQDAPPASVVIALPGTASRRGRVVDAGGTPLAGAQLAVAAPAR